jgi:hypothetical protein
VSPEIIELIPPLKPAAPLSVPAKPPEVVEDNRLDHLLLVWTFRVAAREALPKLMGCTVPAFNPLDLATAESRSGVVVARPFGTDETLGSPGNL